MTEAGATASIVVPAHNEEAVLPRCLEALLGAARPGEFDVVVAANACTDGTADIARAAGVRVVETTTPGKVPALRTGDATCTIFPRFYVDADVEIDAHSLRELVTALQGPGILAAAPVPQFDLTGASPTIRRVHRVHQALMRTRRGLAGAGVYALTEEGHARVFPLPDVIADDSWVHAGFTPAERTVVQGASSLVRPARTVRSELRRRVRVRAGNRQLEGFGRAAAEERLRMSMVMTLVTRRSVTPLDAAHYLAVVAVDRLLSTTRNAPGSDVGWATDTSSRTTAGTRSGGSM